MAKIADKFVTLKTYIGGNREKTGYEDTFGMPREERQYITRPNKANNRIISELEFALHLSEETGMRISGKKLTFAVEPYALAAVDVRLV